MQNMNKYNVVWYTYTKLCLSSSICHNREENDGKKPEKNKNYQPKLQQ